MGIWYFWEEYLRALDNFPKREVQRIVTDTSSRLDREAENKAKVSRFLYCIQQMPRAWGSRPWSSHELLKAGNNIKIDLFRRKMKRDLGIR